MATIKISVTGNKAGFTLIELLVVVAIMSIVLTVAVLTISDNRPAFLLRQETTRLHDALRTAADDAVLSGRQWAFMPAPDGYRFIYFDTLSGQWTESDQRDLGNYILPDRLKLALESSNQLILPADQGSVHPPLLFLSSGITSAFSLVLRDKHDDRLVARLATTGDSNISENEGDGKK